MSQDINRNLAFISLFDRIRPKFFWNKLIPTWWHSLNMFQNFFKFFSFLCPMAKKDINREQFQKITIARLRMVRFSKFFRQIVEKRIALHNYNSSKLQSRRNMFGYLLFHKILILKFLIMLGTIVSAPQAKLFVWLVEL